MKKFPVPPGVDGKDDKTAAVLQLLIHKILPLAPQIAPLNAASKIHTPLVVQLLSVHRQSLLQVYLYYGGLKHQHSRYTSGLMGKSADAILEMALIKVGDFEKIVFDYDVVPRFTSRRTAMKVFNGALALHQRSDSPEQEEKAFGKPKEKAVGLNFFQFEECLARLAVAIEVEAGEDVDNERIAPHLKLDWLLRHISEASVSLAEERDFVFEHIPLAEIDDEWKALQDNEIDEDAEDELGFNAQRYEALKAAQHGGGVGASSEVNDGKTEDMTEAEESSAVLTSRLVGRIMLLDDAIDDEMAHKIAGMLLELDTGVLVAIAKDQNRLRAKVDEAIAVLNDV
eukprot:CAMPEP_0113875332 /NCGR_PEP_ID=MMETSP0780_2-20120614/4889_1 /TAXON_ID=652834 /ORGANISM="Palpitomonas bilix" /LENGTH=340 /DNA_ID=CAMNT_0000861321 /DNA_START=359 /DNA_END=1381 /DNA_ORIENTATION=- /assembly_acc=CAM_ASM_000599